MIDSDKLRKECVMNINDLTDLITTGELDQQHYQRFCGQLEAMRTVVAFIDNINCAELEVLL